MTEIKNLDVITSAYNEEKCIPELYARLADTISLEKNYSWRLLIFDNGSLDSTWSEIQKLSKSHSNVLGFRMSKNFSLDAAFTAGIDRATGDVAVIMCSDLQDPPEAIPLLLREYEKGAEQVLVRITSRKSVPLPRRLLSKIFYKIAHKLTQGMLPELVSDFRLLNRQAYKSVAQMRESHRFMRGLSAWVGFRTAFVDLERPPRFAGESSWLKTSIFAVIGNALKSIFSHTTKPLIWISVFGFFTSLGSLLGIIIMSIIWLFSSVPFAGFGTIVGLISLGFSLTMLCMGIIAQYLALIFEEVKQRPLYIIAEEAVGSFESN